MAIIILGMSAWWSGAGLQVREDAPGPLVKWYRHISKGAWPFSTRDHGWPISDCSSEGLKVEPCYHACPSFLSNTEHKHALPSCLLL